MIRIKSKKDGFRRCGVAHPSTETTYPDNRFSEKELEILKAEPMLLVEEIPDADPDKQGSGKKEPGKVDTDNKGKKEEDK